MPVPPSDPRHPLQKKKLGKKKDVKFKPPKK